jgi:hypothetical protein
MFHHRSALVHLVSDSLVMREDNPPASTNFWQPLIVRSGLSKVRRMVLNSGPGVSQDFREPMPEVAICEVRTDWASRSRVAGHHALLRRLLVQHRLFDLFCLHAVVCSYVRDTFARVDSTDNRSC